MKTPPDFQAAEFLFGAADFPDVESVALRLEGCLPAVKYNFTFTKAELETIISWHCCVESEFDADAADGELVDRLIKLLLSGAA